MRKLGKFRKLLTIVEQYISDNEIEPVFLIEEIDPFNETIESINQKCKELLLNGVENARLHYLFFLSQNNMLEDERIELENEIHFNKALELSNDEDRIQMEFEMKLYRAFYKSEELRKLLSLFRFQDFNRIYQFIENLPTNAESTTNSSIVDEIKEVYLNIPFDDEMLSFYYYLLLFFYADLTESKDLFDFIIQSVDGSYSQFAEFLLLKLYSLDKITNRTLESITDVLANYACEENDYVFSLICDFFPFYASHALNYQMKQLMTSVKDIFDEDMIHLRMERYTEKRNFYFPKGSVELEYLDADPYVLGWWYYDHKEYKKAYCSYKKAFDKSFQSDYEALIQMLYSVMEIGIGNSSKEDKTRYFNEFIEYIDSLPYHKIEEVYYINSLLAYYNPLGNDGKYKENDEQKQRAMQIAKEGLSYEIIGYSRFILEKIEIDHSKESYDLKPDIPLREYYEYQQIMNSLLEKKSIVKHNFDKYMNMFACNFDAQIELADYAREALPRDEKRLHDFIERVRYNCDYPFEIEELKNGSPHAYYYHANNTGMWRVLEILYILGIYVLSFTTNRILKTNANTVTNTIYFVFIFYYFMGIRISKKAFRSRHSFGYSCAMAYFLSSMVSSIVGLLTMQFSTDANTILLGPIETIIKLPSFTLPDLWESIAYGIYACVPFLLIASLFVSKFKIHLALARAIGSIITILYLIILVDAFNSSFVSMLPITLFLFVLLSRYSYRGALGGLFKFFNICIYVIVPFGLFAMAIFAPSFSGSTIQPSQFVSFCQYFMIPIFITALLNLILCKNRSVDSESEANTLEIPKGKGPARIAIASFVIVAPVIVNFILIATNSDTYLASIGVSMEYYINNKGIDINGGLATSCALGIVLIANAILSRTRINKAVFILNLILVAAITALTFTSLDSSNGLGVLSYSFISLSDCNIGIYISRALIFAEFIFIVYELKVMCKQQTVNI